METVRPATELRENVLRYAAFLTYLKEVKAGTIGHYGTSRKEVVRQIQKDLGDEAAAAHMARNLLGDYGNLTALGDWLRMNLVPFWAFQEINLKRYPRLAIEAIRSGQGKGRTATVFAVAASLRIGALYGAFWTWNNLIWPMLSGDDDEEDLPPYDRANPHILLGRNPDGTVKLFRNVGALGDFLEWFGINEALSLTDKYRGGQIGGWDLVKEAIKAPAEKMINSLRPDVKGGFEVLTGQSLFPSAFEPRSVRRGEAATNIVGLADEYRWMKGKILQRGDRTRPHYWQRWGLGVVDPRQTALSEMYDLRRRFLDGKGAPEKGVYPISQYKQARDAAIAEDYNAFIEWKKIFQKENPGFKGGDKFNAFLRRLDPIAARLSAEDEREFELSYLSNEQREKLQVARDFAAELRDRLAVWWRTDDLSPQQ